MVAQGAEIVEGVENVVERNARVGGLRLVERRAARSVHILSLQRPGHPRHILHQFHLQINHFKDTDVGVVVAHLFGFGERAVGRIGQHAARFVPNAQNGVPAQRPRLGTFGIEEHAFGAIAQDAVHDGDEAVDVFLLVDYVFNKTVHFSIGEGIKFHHKGVRAVAIGRIESGEHIAHRGEPAASPHGGNIPFIADVRVGFDFLFHADRHHRHLSGGFVVAKQHFLALQRPHLNHAAFVGAGKPKRATALRVGADSGAEL